MENNKKLLKSFGCTIVSMFWHKIFGKKSIKTTMNNPIQDLLDSFKPGDDINIEGVENLICTAFARGVLQGSENVLNHFKECKDFEQFELELKEGLKKLEDKKMFYKKEKKEYNN